jgi:hypothetical protein
MSVTAVEAPAAASHVDVPARAPRAVAVRRWFLVASPVLAGLFAVVGAWADPGAGISGREMWEIYAAEPDPLQWKSLGFHWSYSFWVTPALLLAAYVRGKGAWIANVAALLGFVGMTTLPGLLIVDFYDSAIGQLYGVDATAAVSEHMSTTMWGAAALAMPGMIGFMLALPLAALALWRAGLARWWAPLSVVAGYAAFLFSDVMWWGCAITAVLFTVFAVAVERATRPTRA